MSKLEIKQKQRIRELETALEPFAKVVVRMEGSVWFYVGYVQEGANTELHTDHFLMAQHLLRK